MRIILLTSLWLMASQLKAQQVNFSLENLENKLVHFNDIRGSELTVIDFWATWCSHCKKLLPKLNEIYTESDTSVVKIIGVSIDDPRSMMKVKPFVRAQQIQYPVLLDPDRVLADQLNIVSVPAFVILDAKGNILYEHEGYSYGDEDIIREKISAFTSHEK